MNLTLLTVTFTATVVLTSTVGSVSIYTPLRISLRERYSRVKLIEYTTASNGWILLSLDVILTFLFSITFLLNRFIHHINLSKNVNYNIFW